MFQMEIVIWVVNAVVVAAAVAYLFYQQRQYRQLQDELVELKRYQRHTVEYDLVLKAMKLTIWHIDLPTMTISFDTDYRDRMDNVDIVKGTPVDSVIAMMPAPYGELVRKSLDDLVTGRVDETRQQYKMCHPQNGRTYWGKLFATVERRDLNGQPLSVVGTSMRIDKQKATEQALIDARNKAEESDRLKSAFLANMSHEIRTPLNAIVGFSDVLPMAQSDEEREELVNLIKQNNAHLLRLFDDIVNMAKIEAGDSKIDLTTFRLDDLFSEIADTFGQQASEKGLTLQVHQDGDEMTVTTDRNRLRKILTHYMDNALKFTETGGVTMGATRKDGLLRIWVKDTGKGIPSEYCDGRLFERFVKVDDFVAGTGLGLSICRSLAQSMGGRVGVESAVGHGSCFWVELASEN